MAPRLTIIRMRRVSDADINQELQWLGNSLGLFGLRDRDSSCFRVFITLVRTARQDRPLTSDEIAERLRLSRGTVVHHLSKLMDSGIVVKEQSGYILRESDLQRLVDGLRRDMDAWMAELLDVARDIDEKLG